MFGTLDILVSLKNKITKEEEENANKFNKYFINRGDELTVLGIGRLNRKYDFFG